MDDLDGLFGAPMATQQPPMQGMGMMPNNMGGMQTNMGMSQGNPNMMPIIPTQTSEASQQANKSQILNQFQANSGQQMYAGQPGIVQPGMGQMGMMGAPARPAPVVPNQGNMFPGQQQFQLPGQQMMQQQPQNFLPVPDQQSFPVGSSGNLILSNSFTEPGPVDLDPMSDPFAENKSEITADIPDAGSSFYIDENEISAENKEEAKVEDVKDEGKETLAPETPKEGEAVSPQPKTSFWSRWSRNKDSGSKEDILDENDKKAADKTEDEGRGGNEQKFLGDGQTFKGKLIGVLEVREARGDRMCQDALQELKMAIKASGEHKQKVNIQIAVDGLKIRDEKSGDCLYHHPVHKISFIAQDMTDNRAFGYIYGSPENGHRFFGIKTEKAAGQVVVAMRDLFQVVFELKKKEIDEAKQSIETGDSVTDTSSAAATSAASFPDGAASAASKSSAIDDLLGLENEISAIQAGIQQIDKITPNPPMSFQTDSMLPLSLSGPQVPQQPVVQQPAQKKPVAVMNQNPASDFGTPPFLPPPPSKVGRRQEDRYAVFDNVQSPRAPQNQNPPQPQQNNQGFGNTPFLDSGASGDSSIPSIFSQPPSLGLSDTGSGMFGGMNQQQGMFGQPPQQQQQQVAAPAPMSMGGASKNSGSQDLASLFTDLDPLGSGKSKPFVDKKNFFNDSKAKLKMTGASEDSLTNVGLSITDSIFDPNIGISESNYTNSILSSSSCMSTSRYSDTFWSSTMPRSLEASAPAQPVPTIHTETWENPPSYSNSRTPSRPCYIGTGASNTLRVALPPEDVGRRSISPGINTQNSNTYGSILELEASPRRYRNKELHDFYSTSQDSPTYTSSRYAVDFDSSVESSLNIPMPREPPPALPERPPKLTSHSPPPLPPKKQTIMTMSMNSNYGPPLSRQETFGEQPSDIYDFIPDPVIDTSNLSHFETKKCISDIMEMNQPKVPSPVPPLPRREPEITIQDLVKMNVVELSQKLVEGKLPPHLSGMSLFELVEYVSKQSLLANDDTPHLTARSQDSLDQTSQPTFHTPDIKPSFSDNFVANNSSLVPNMFLTKGQEESPQCTSLEQSQISRKSSIHQESHTFQLDSAHKMLQNKSTDDLALEPLQYRMSPHLASPHVEPGPAEVLQNLGFEDDFSHFNPDRLSNKVSASSIPEPVQSVTDDANTSLPYDKYAAFRELQMEEEIVNAWKSPTEDMANAEDFLPGEEKPEEVDLFGLGDDDNITDDVENTQMYPNFESEPNKELEVNEPNGVSDSNETNNELNPDNEDSFYVPKVCSSEGSPCSRSDSGSRKSVSDEEHSGDDETRKEFNEDQEHDTNVLEDNPLAESEKTDRIGNGAATAVYISPQHNPKRNAGNENNAFEDNFSSNYELNDNSSTVNDNDNETKGGWATFEDQEDKACEFSTFLSKDEQDKLLSKRTNMFRTDFIKKEPYQKFSNRPDMNSDQGYVSSHADTTQQPFTDTDGKSKFSIQSPKTLRDLPTTASFHARYQNFKRFDQQASPPKSPKATFKNQRLAQDEDPFEADWEPAFYTRSQSTDPTFNNISEDSWHLNFDSRHNRPGTEPPKQWSTAWREPQGAPDKHLNIEEAFPPSRQDLRIKSRQSSSRGSSDSIFNNPFNDNFVSSGRAVSATPPVFEGEVHSDRISNASDLSFQSGEFLESQDVFDKHNAFATSGFKVQAKTVKLPKSESVDIFSVSADPFDDDFFK